LRPAKGQDQAGVLGGGNEPLPPARDSVSFPSGFGRSRKCILGVFTAQKHADTTGNQRNVSAQNIQTASKLPKNSPIFESKNLPYFESSNMKI